MQGMPATSCLMGLKCKWRLSRGKASPKSFSKILWLACPKKRLRSIRNWMDSQECSRWLWSQFQSRTLTSGETCSKMSSCLEETRCLRAFKREFKSSFQTSALRTSKLKCSEEATAASCPGSEAQYFLLWGHSNRCGWADKSMRSMEQLWLRENALEGFENN